MTEEIADLLINFRQTLKQSSHDSLGRTLETTVQSQLVEKCLNSHILTKYKNSFKPNKYKKKQIKSIQTKLDNISSLLLSRELDFSISTDDLSSESPFESTKNEDYLKNNLNRLKMLNKQIGNNSLVLKSTRLNKSNRPIIKENVYLKNTLDQWIQSRSVTLPKIRTTLTSPKSDSNQLFNKYDLDVTQSEKLSKKSKQTNPRWIFRQSSLLQFDPKDLAEQLTYIEALKFYKIDVSIYYITNKLKNKIK